MSQAVPYPRDVATHEDAEQESAGDVGDGEHQGCDAGAASEDDGYDHARERAEGHDGFDEGAEWISPDTTVGGLQKLLQLAEQKRDTKIKDDPLDVRVADRSEAREVVGR